MFQHYDNSPPRLLFDYASLELKVKMILSLRNQICLRGLETVGVENCLITIKKTIVDGIGLTYLYYKVRH